MTLGKITGTKTRNENNEFNGMDITARFLASDGRFKDLSFHYAYWTNNFRGMVEKVLDANLTGKTLPEQFTDVKVG